MAAVVGWILAWWVVQTLLGLGNTVGYHRLLTHRAFVAKPWVRATWTILGALHGGSPVVWVGLHRLHHAKSDGEEDPHSPIYGFWWAHCGWLIGTRSPWLAIPFALSGFGQQGALFVHDVKRALGLKPPTWRQLCPDLMKEPLMRALEVPFVTFAMFLAQLALAWFVGGWWGILWLWAMHLTLTNGSWAVNSVSHWRAFGRNPWDSRDLSRDVPWLALFTHGEGYHNAHHRYPRSARHGLEGGPDLSWLVIVFMCRLGLAEKPWLPRAYREQTPPAA